MLKNHRALILSLLFLPSLAIAQPCTPQGDQVTYGTNNVWIGYVYDNQNFTNYLGYVNEGSPSSPDFNQDFGGSYTNFPTNGCTLYTETFTIRYKLIKTFAAGSYTFTISGDDRIRLSLDGGATWMIDNWNYNGYLPGSATVNLNGTYNMVLEYLEGAHQNHVYFNVMPSCTASGNTMLYGSGNIWNGYFYAGTNFEEYKGMVTRPVGVNLAFNENFGGPSVDYTTSDCPVRTDFFSVRYRMQHNFPFNSYTFTVSGDDKYRLSLDGGNTWVIDRWNYNAGNTTRMYTSNLNGSYDIVLEYYDKDGDNLIQFSSNNNILLPVNFTSFAGRRTGEGIVLNWSVANQEGTVNFEIERSEDAISFQPIGTIGSSERNNSSYSFTDVYNQSGLVYYRIKITDLQGRVIYSRSISLLNEGKGIRIYPTFVTNGTIYLNNDNALAGATLVINDMAGRPVIQRKLGHLTPGQTTSLYINDLKLRPGIYFVHLIGNGQAVKTEKIIVQ